MRGREREVRGNRLKIKDVERERIMEREKMVKRERICGKRGIRDRGRERFREK